MTLDKYILEKMLRKRIIGSKHIRYVNIVSAIPGHQKKHCKEAITILLKKGYLVWYNKSKKAIQLNKNKTKEIKEYLLK
jgi:hypothetical protein